MPRYFLMLKIRLIFFFEPFRLERTAVASVVIRTPAHPTHKTRPTTTCQERVLREITEAFSSIGVRRRTSLPSWLHAREVPADAVPGPQTWEAKATRSFANSFDIVQSPAWVEWLAISSVTFSLKALSFYF
jgi:hypothetical protein